MKEAKEDKNKNSDIIPSRSKNKNKDIKKMEIRIVAQGNPLVEAKYTKKYSEREFKMSRFIITEVRKKYYNWKVGDDPNNIILKISAKKYAEALQVDISNVYRDSLEVLRGLKEKSFTVLTKTGWSLFGWFNKADYDEGMLDIKMCESIIPYILNLPPGYTKYTFENIIKLRSSYSIQLYELLKQYEAVGSRKITIEDFKSFMGINEMASYKLYGNIKLYIIDIAIKDINDNTDINVTFEEIKTVRKVTELDFKIINKPKCAKLLHYEKAKKEKKMDKKEIEHTDDISKIVAQKQISKIREELSNRRNKNV